MVNVKHLGVTFNISNKRLKKVHVTAINKKKSGDDKSVYNCPVYKYPKRTDKYLIFRVNLNSETDPPSKWKLKGVALLCAKD